MAHIFVSYSRKDKDYARKLVVHLFALGFDVWFDEHIEYCASYAVGWFKRVAIRYASNKNA
jgi:hypothetical protein